MLTIFKKQPDSDLYERIEEAHYQRAYSIDCLRELLADNGLSMEECFDADMVHRPNETSERIYLIVRV